MITDSVSFANMSVSKPDFDVVIIGGGLAGLTCAIVLAKAGKKILLLEKKTYPHHKVCGEYISNEVLGYVRSLGFDPFHFGATNITSLRISTPGGKNIYTPLGLGGFGISRYTMDEALYKLAVQAGAEICTGTRVTGVQFLGQLFKVGTANAVYTSKLVIGAYGKRETLDKELGRSFMNERTRYMGVKYHIRTDRPQHEIGLDNFDGGYCGISKVDHERYNLCYLYRRPAGSNHASIDQLQQNVLYQNPVLKRIFNDSDFLFAKPLVINELNFSQKTQIEDHILMCGDTAGLITPLCGNGMSMAISTAQLLTSVILASDILDNNVPGMQARRQLEQNYQDGWSARFSKRLWWGTKLQSLFGKRLLTEAALTLLDVSPLLRRALVRKTHGEILFP